jgi:hypothetical protein
MKSVVRTNDREACGPRTRGNAWDEGNQVSQTAKMVHGVDRSCVAGTFQCSVSVGAFSVSGARRALRCLCVCVCVTVLEGAPPQGPSALSDGVPWYIMLDSLCLSTLAECVCRRCVCVGVLPTVYMPLTCAWLASAGLFLLSSHGT